MALTSEDLAAAFAPLIAIKKNKRIQVDIGKIATSLVDGTEAIMIGDGDPIKKVEDLEKKVDEIGALLEGVEFDQDLDGYFTNTDPSGIAAEFAITKVEEAPEPADETPEAEPVQEEPEVTKAEDETPEAEPVEPEPADETPEEETPEEEPEVTKAEDETTEETTEDEPVEETPEETTEGEPVEETPEAEVEKEDEPAQEDAEVWPNDMAPERPPVLKSERMTKSEVPVMARRGSDEIEKWRRARDRAMGADEGRSTE